MSDSDGNGGREAALLYQGATFEIKRAGDHVRCAITGRKIPLSHLRYWSVEKQEPYESAEIALQAELKRREGKH